MIDGFAVPGPLRIHVGRSVRVAGSSFGRWPCSHVLSSLRMIYSSAARLTLPQMAYRVTLLRIILAGWQPHGLALLPCLIASSPSHFILAVPENQLVVIALGTSEIADLHVGVSAVQVGWLIFRIQSQAGRVVADRGVVIAFASIDDADPGTPLARHKRPRANPRSPVAQLASHPDSSEQCRTIVAIGPRSLASRFRRLVPGLDRAPRSPSVRWAMPR